MFIQYLCIQHFIATLYYGLRCDNLLLNEYMMIVMMMKYKKSRQNANRVISLEYYCYRITEIEMSLDEHSEKCFRNKRMYVRHLYAVSSSSRPFSSDLSQWIYHVSTSMSFLVRSRANLELMSILRG